MRLEQTITWGGVEEWAVPMRTASDFDAVMM